MLVNVFLSVIFLVTIYYAINMEGGSVEYQCSIILMYLFYQFNLKGSVASDYLKIQIPLFRKRISVKKNRNKKQRNLLKYLNHNN